MPGAKWTLRIPGVYCSFIQYFAMNAPLLSEILLRSEPTAQVELGLATEGVLRYVWGSRWGDMLIEVVHGTAYVNGNPVEPFCPPDKSNEA